MFVYNINTVFFIHKTKNIPNTGPVFPDGFNVETASPKDYFDLMFIPAKSLSSSTD
jgi:hypothetical protein